MVEQQVGLLGLQRSIFAPLVIGGKVWGILCIGATNLTAGDVPAVALFANQTSIALQKARLLSELQASHRQLRQLAHEVVNAQEVERRHLASALHDEAGQALTALRINLELIEEELPPKCQSLQERVGDAAGLAASTMHRIRAIAQDLRPPALDALGLSPTLEDACRRFSRHTGLDIDYSGARAPALAEEVNICLYRLLQEALANVARHAEAHHVQVTLQCDDEAISLSVEDDGRGFDVLAQQDAPPTPDLPGGIGLLGMRERVESLGGRLAIRSLPGHGTLLATHIPFKEAGHGT